MQGAWLWAAAALSAITFCVHTFVSGVRVARPFLADEGLPKASKWLNYYCWHIVTVLLAAMAVAYAATASGRVRTDVAWLLGVLAALFSGLSAWVARRGDIHPLRFPSTTLFALVALVTLGASVSG